MKLDLLFLVDYVHIYNELYRKSLQTTYDMVTILQGLLLVVLLVQKKEIIGLDADICNED